MQAAKDALLQALRLLRRRKFIIEHSGGVRRVPSPGGARSPTRQPRSPHCTRDADLLSTCWNAPTLPPPRAPSRRRTAPPASPVTGFKRRSTLVAPASPHEEGRRTGGEHRCAPKSCPRSPIPKAPYQRYRRRGKAVNPVAARAFVQPNSSYDLDGEQRHVVPEAPPRMVTSGRTATARARVARRSAAPARAATRSPRASSATRSARWSPRPTPVGPRRPPRRRREWPRRRRPRRTARCRRSAGRLSRARRLTTSKGTWSNSATSYAYAWEDCDGSGTSCSVISRASAKRLQAHRKRCGPHDPLRRDGQPLGWVRGGYLGADGGRGRCPAGAVEHGPAGRERNGAARPDADHEQWVVGQPDLVRVPVAGLRRLGGQLRRDQRGDVLSQSCHWQAWRPGHGATQASNMAKSSTKGEQYLVTEFNPGHIFNSNRPDLERLRAGEKRRRQRHPLHSDGNKRP